MKNVNGFTLVELMIVVAIVGIVSAISYPSFDRYMKKSGRADAKVGLSKVADKQERYYLQNSIYAANTGLLGLADPWVTDEGYYEVTVASSSVSGFTLTATPVAGQPQTKDLDCTTMSLSSTGQKTATGADPTKCW